jgi:2-succinyl-5-enolpyruvyl-6-hydroxy-3-cyclohexene-1-carboxylate synthase
VVSAPPRPDEVLLDELAERVAGEPRGLIVAGRQTNPAIAEPVAALARAAGYPILAEPTSQLRLGPHDRDLVVARYDPVARAAPAALDPGLIVRIGDMPTSKPLRQWLGGLDGLRQVVVDPGYGFNDPSLRAESIVRADPAALAGGLASRIAATRTQPSWLDAWRETEASVAAALEAELESLGAATEPGVHAALGSAYSDGDLVYTASSMPIRDQEAFLAPGPADVTFLCNRGANGIDGLVSSGIGGAVASGRATTIVLGDLALVHDLGGLLGLRHASSPVRIVVIDNGGGGIFHFLPQAEVLDADEFEALLGTPSGVEPWQAASMFGLEHRPVGDLSELGDALDAGTGLITVKVDRRANVQVHERLRDAAHEALRSV